MTVQLASHLAHGKSKKVLQEALSRTPGQVRFYDPSIFSGSRGVFTGAAITAGDRFAVVMDPDTRRRFATVVCKADGTFKVE